MYSIQVKGHFSAAHFLEDYDGLCGSVHGHRWEVVLKVEAPKDEKSQMIIDFTHLKWLLEELTSQIDHSFILDPMGNEASKDFVRIAEKHKMRIFKFSGRSTAENIAEYLYKQIGKKLTSVKYSVTVYEAPNNCVTYIENGMEE